MLSDPQLIVWITLTFLVGGAVKGVIGMGLPTWSIGMLTAAIGLHPAMALMLVPTIVTNIWQALVGGHFRAVLMRVWPFLLTATGAILVGAPALTRIHVSWLSALLGFLLAAYGLFGLLRPSLSLAGYSETRVGVIAGFINGFLGGMTGAFAVPGVPYLQALGLQRDQLIQAMGILFTLSTVALAVGLGGQKLLTFDLGLASTLAVFPALVGMAVGQALRRRIPEAVFRKVFLSALIVLGGYIVLRAFLT
jgi:uncharacterized membrane protein YfcA